jgi:putative membrane protein
MMYWDGDSSGWAWFAMTLSIVLFWAGVGVVIWLLLRHQRDSAQNPPASSAEELLRRRFGAGDIDEAEFEGRIATLRDTAGRSRSSARRARQGQ